MKCANCRHENRNHRVGLPCRCGCDRYETADDRHARNMKRLSDWTTGIDAFLKAADRLQVTVREEQTAYNRWSEFGTKDYFWVWLEARSHVGEAVETYRRIREGRTE